MAAHFSLTTRSPANIRPHLPPPHRSFPFSRKTPKQSNETCTRNQRNQKKIRASNGESYLEMWKDAMERERKEVEFQTILNNSSAAAAAAATEEEDNGLEVLERKSDQFKKILEVPTEERDKVQRMQVIDRAAAAIAAAQALLKENPPPTKAGADAKDANINSNASSSLQGAEDGGSFVNNSTISRYGTPGPDFWSWSPPPDSKGNLEETTKFQISQKPSSYSSGVSSLIEKERAVNTLLLPFESTLFEGSHKPPLPPLQSLMEVKKVNAPSPDLPTSAEECELEVLFSTHATEAVDALQKVGEASSHGMNVDGSKWWKETGTEQRPDGVVCKWTLTRGVSSDGGVEWEEKYWEAADQFDYKELGSEKSGRDAEGNVWHEYWKEAMWQDFKSGLVHIEKTADKWGKKTGMGDEWQEKWWEHYDASGQAEKWAHKWCCIDPDTPLEAGHAHVWHERWGEKYDGQGSSMKYTDKWAERSEGDGWTKWGDKWDENFDAYGHGIKQGEKWWQGKYGEQWNRTWGEHHNGSGWVHKYGKSSSGEHWDTHVQQDTWYERYPHYGFELCFKNSVQLQQVQNPPEVS